MSRFRLGIIDLGTNSVRFDVHEVSGGKVSRMLHRERLMVRLGEGVFLNGQMDREAIARTTEAFASFRYTADQLAVHKVVAIATSAVRQASDRERLIQSIKKRAGIDVRVISGEEEARLIARGILSREKKLPKKFALVDIGGGSTEVSLCRDRRVVWSSSFRLGTARLEQLFKVGAPGLPARVREVRIKELRAHIRKMLGQRSAAKPISPVKTIIGSSGTVKAFARLQGEGDPDQRSVSRRFLKGMLKKMSRMTRDELLDLPGMDPTRVDMMLSGGVILDEVMDLFEAAEVRLTEFALREGVLDDEVRVLRDKRDSRLGMHLEDLESRLRRSLTNPVYGQRVGAVCDDLFSRLAPLHRLKPRWRHLLRAAALLQNTGRSISALQHAEHSFYITEHLDFPWLEDDERSLLAHMCLWHTEGKLSPKDLRFIQSAADRAAFLKTMAMLRLANALVWHDRSSVKILRAAFRGRSAHLKVWANGARELVKLRVETRKKLFERAFKRKLSIET